MLTMIGHSSANALLAATAKKSSSGIFEVYIIFVVVVIGYMVFVRRPRQQRLRQHQATSREFDVGTEVLTAGGIVGTVIEIDGDRVTIETSVGASFVVLRPYILRRMDIDEAMPASAPGFGSLFGGGRSPASRSTPASHDEGDDVEEYDEETAEHDEQAEATEGHEHDEEGS